MHQEHQDRASSGELLSPLSEHHLYPMARVYLPGPFLDLHPFHGKGTQILALRTAADVISSKLNLNNGKPVLDQIQITSTLKQKSSSISITLNSRTGIRKCESDYSLYITNFRRHLPSERDDRQVPIRWRECVNDRNPRIIALRCRIASLMKLNPETDSRAINQIACISTHRIRELSIHSRQRSTEIKINSCNIPTKVTIYSYKIFHLSVRVSELLYPSLNSINSLSKLRLTFNKIIQLHYETLVDAAATVSRNIPNRLALPRRTDSSTSCSTQASPPPTPSSIPRFGR